MTFALLRSQIKARSLHQINLLSRASYHGVQKGQSFFIPPAYPDSTEPPIMVLNDKTRVLKWDEANATLSEASVKADRELTPKERTWLKDKIAEFEKTKPPEMDEM